MDGSGRIVQFAEKPKGADLKAMVSMFRHRCYHGYYDKKLFYLRASLL